ncbi:SusC/RagA family TonB-linked outer membrane protein [Gynurincola endophyticus]|uniref:SusC/RagA family TonB-linked outer membrane protein n=1 Tax=Gynurincola endophyticus TaxID=2479004 RepID=UPI000F8EC599|nr:SusC/RagA family TonB-linked outer membrane protein [Gynurincola endophyticus]
MRKLVWLFLITLTSLGSLMAQGRVITGKVTDEAGSPLPNVSITISGSTTGTSTKPDGTYSINVTGENVSLVFSSVDKEPQTVRVGTTNVLNIVLLAKSDDLDEVIVVAYGTVKKSANVGATAQIGAKDLAERPVTNALNALVGSAPGIQTTVSSGAPGSSPNIRLRGFTSYNSDNSPLIVVDGAPFSGSLADINPDDIATITTMKDGPSAALYGSRAANGVIAVTTKTGTKAGGSMNIKVLKGITSRAVPDYDKVNAFEYYPLMFESLANATYNTSASAPVPMDIARQLAAGTWGNRNSNGLQVYNGRTYNDVYRSLGRYNPFVGIANDAIVGADGLLNPNATQLKYDDLDWYDAFFRNGNRDEVSFQAGGKAGKSDYTSSFNYLKENGFVDKTDQKRFTGRVGVNTQVVDWLKTGINVSYARSNGNSAPTSGIVNPFYWGRYAGPIYPVYLHDANGGYVLDADGNKQFDPGDAGGGAARPFNLGRHGLWEHELNSRLFSRELITSRGYIDVYLMPGLTFTSTLSADMNSNKNNVRENTQVGDGAPAGRASQTWTKTQTYTFNQLLKYNKQFDLHNLDLMAGHENYDYKYNYIYGFKSGEIFSDGNVEYPNYSTITSMNSYEDNYRIESYLGRVNYDYDSKYFLSVSLRRDGNSRFHKDHRWDNFYTIGASWRIDREEFMTNINSISTLKLRASYGKTGNDRIGSYYAYQRLFDLGYNNQNFPGVLLASLGNDKLTWETLKQFNVALDFGLFNNRIFGTVEYYDRKTDGMIFDVPQPYQAGGTPGNNYSIPTNIGLLLNRGIEIELGADIIRSKDWGLNVTVNATTLSNVMKTMPDATPKIQNGTKQLEVGYSIYEYYLRQWYGVDPSDGAPLFYAGNTTATGVRYAANSKGGTDTLTTDIANAKWDYVNKSAIPDVYGGVRTSLRYKALTLNVVMNYQIGGWMYDGEYAGLMHGGVYGTASHVDALNRWTTPGQITNVPKFNNANTTNIAAGTSTRWLIDASYFNLASVALNYNFSSAFTSKIGAKSANVFASAENLAFFSRRKGLMSNESFNGTVGNGYPMARVVTVGLNLGF